MAFPGLIVDRTLLMCWDCNPNDLGGLEVVQLHDEEEVIVDCCSVGRPVTRDSCLRRRNAGFQFYSLRRSEHTIANTWTIRGGERFLDEAMLVFELGQNDACLRDIYIHHGERGRGVFRQFVNQLAAGPLAGIERLWSCVELNNPASIAAHRRAGFKAAGSVCATSLLDRILLRRCLLPPNLDCQDFQSPRRILWMGASARAFRLAHLA